ncbi:hypothetical protein SNR37_000247 [Agarivorans aestuarii]|uniref:Uncharacterized protein n=1 Tax=Agarivorans aestuarii TaxID=1563703 RepID=A0ABU7G6T2_9ALTE|nr:hypothetical protein [Agarivorans aestuarii]MEE1674927.1 hypothetical protein [Agarivorans aestuarii]
MEIESSLKIITEMAKQNKAIFIVGAIIFALVISLVFDAASQGVEQLRATQDCQQVIDSGTANIIRRERHRGLNSQIESLKLRFKDAYVFSAGWIKSAKPRGDGGFICEIYVQHHFSYPRHLYIYIQKDEYWQASRSNKNDEVVIGELDLENLNQS